MNPAEIFHQLRNVFPAVSQPRHRYFQYVNPVIEVGSKTPGDHLIFFRLHRSLWSERIVRSDLRVSRNNRPGESAKACSAGPDPDRQFRPEKACLDEPSPRDPAWPRWLP